MTTQTTPITRRRSRTRARPVQAGKKHRYKFEQSGFRNSEQFFLDGVFTFSIFFENLSSGPFDFPPEFHFLTFFEMLFWDLPHFLYNTLRNISFDLPLKPLLSVGLPPTDWPMTVHCLRQDIPYLEADSCRVPMCFFHKPRNSLPPVLWHPSFPLKQLTGINPLHPAAVQAHPLPASTPLPPEESDHPGGHGRPSSTNSAGV